MNRDPEHVRLLSAFGLLYWALLVKRVYVYAAPCDRRVRRADLQDSIEYMRLRDRQVIVDDWRLE